MSILGQMKMKKQKPSLLDKIYMSFIKRSKRASQIIDKCCGEAYDIGFKSGFGEGMKESLGKSKNPKLNKKIDKAIKRNIYKESNIKKD